MQVAARAHDTKMIFPFVIGEIQNPSDFWGELGSRLEIN
jgi:hypothetical protein